MYFYLQAVFTEPNIMWLQDSNQHQTKPTVQIADVINNGKNSNLPLGMNTIGWMISININKHAKITNAKMSTFVRTVLWPPR